MAIKPEPSSTSTRLSVWVLAACALAAGAVAFVLVWQNAELKSELNALKREKPIGKVSIPILTSGEKPVQGKAITSTASADAPQAQGGQPMSLLDALRASEQAARNNRNATSALYPFEPRKR